MKTLFNFTTLGEFQSITVLHIFVLVPILEICGGVNKCLLDKNLLLCHRSVALIMENNETRIIIK